LSRKFSKIFNERFSLDECEKNKPMMCSELTVTLQIRQRNTLQLASVKVKLQFEKYICTNKSYLDPILRLRNLQQLQHQKKIFLLSKFGAVNFYSAIVLTNDSRIGSSNICIVKIYSAKIA
jgi:hypothetical protein